MVIIGAFVYEFCAVAQHIKAVGKAFGHPQLVLVGRREHGACPLPEGGRFAAQIHGHIKHGAGHHAHKLALGVFGLVVQAAQHTGGGFGMVFLHKGVRSNIRPKPFIAEGFHKKAALITEHFWLEDFHVGNAGGDNIHQSCFLMFQTACDLFKFT